MKIIKLAAQEAQKIAAGEVVERPAHSIKELLENSLDADATLIKLSIKDGGKQQIIISDNGSGMAPEDARICFERHTTSKISSIDQLETITTFGFRGEALASICSVARVTLTTKTADSDKGLQLVIEQGVIVQEKVVGCQTGTTLQIDELFYNVPARKKFLKSTVTEWNHIVMLFKAFALNHYNVHFILEHNGAVHYNCPAVKTVAERVAQLFEGSVAQHSIAVKPLQSELVTITGAVTTQNYTRYDRGGLFFFVNGRWVKNYQLASALTKGYLNVLPAGRYPAAVIVITVDPKTVDINVHPKKEEVQFLHPRRVEAAITQAVKTTLEEHLSEQLKRTVSFAKPQQERDAFVHIPHPFFIDEPFEIQKAEPKKILQEPVQKEELVFPQSEPVIQIFKSAEPEKVEKQQAVEQLGILIGQYRNTYLLLEKQDGLFVVDQHAAHERILYERFAARFSDVPVIELLFPHSIEIAQEDADLLEQYLPLFDEQGIKLERFGPDKFVLKATPVFFKNQPVDDIIQQVLSLIKENGLVEKVELYKTVTEKLRAQMACKAAIKAGDRLSQETMEQLLTDLEITSNRFTCPHGRPTGWFLSVDELERKFKRKL